MCGAVQNKETHAFTGNGQSMLHCTNYRGDAYRKICKCGYQSKPFIVFHGRWENYKDAYKTIKLNYCLGNDADNAPKYKMTDFLQIAKKEFDDHLSELNKLSCISGGQKLDWVDDDGDGYGWVFCGGPVIKSDGIKGSLELIIGSDGDCGRKSSFDENYALIRYFSSTGTPTRQGFVNWLKAIVNKSTNPTKHMLYGYDDKYQNRVTDAQFNKIVAEYKGYWIHAGVAGWSDTCICHTGHQSSGQVVYFSFYCYDSSNDHFYSQSDGIKTDCDLCGSHWSGNEAYESNTWYSCGAWKGLKEGQQVTCSGHRVSGREYMGIIYDTFTKKDGEYYRTVKATATTGYTADVHTSEIKLSRTTSTEYSHESSGYVYFSNGTTGRKVLCYYTNPFIDEDPPVIDTITMTPQTYSGNWATISQLDVSGTENYCNMVYLTVSNKSSGKTIIDKAAVTVTDNKYSYTATPPLEGSENGTVYTLTVQDLYGNTSTKDFTVYNTDGTAPQVESPLSYMDWTAKAKTITLTIADYGSGGVQTSLGDQTHYLACTKTTDGKYQITYTFGDDIIGAKNYDLYLKDALGNATKVTLTVGNIDKNVYNITYDLDGGTATGLKTTYTVEDTFTLPQVAKTGNTFLGYVGSNGTSPQKTVTVSKGTRGDLSYTAKWQVNSYTHIAGHWASGFKNQEGNNGRKDCYNLANIRYTADYGSTFTMGVDKCTNIPNGFHFHKSLGVGTFHTSLNAGTTAQDNTWKRYPMGTKFTQIDKDMEFEYDYDPYDYNITYNLNGGINNSANPSTYNVLYGVSLGTPIKEGSSFDGWCENMLDLSNVSGYQVSVESNSIIFTNNVIDNRLNYGAIQIYSADKTIYYGDFLQGNNGRIKSTYKHALSSGEYQIRIKANGNKEDRSIYVPVYLEQEKTYQMGFNISESSATKIVMKDVYFVATDNKVTGINEGCNATFSSSDDLYAQLAKRRTGNVSLVALWKYNTIHVKVPQTLVSDKSGNGSFRVKCNDIVSGSIKIDTPDTFLYKQSGKSDVQATITRKSSSNIITPTNKNVVYNISTNGLSAGCWNGNFNIGLTLTKE